MEILMLRFDAPLMSFGGVMVDQHGPTDRFPGTSLLTGLFGNALGWHHGDFERLQALQERIRFAARWDVEPEPMCDYHTVDLGQPKMCKAGWTTRGETEHRTGGDARFGTHQRYRHYWANGVLTLAVTLTGEEQPDVQTLAAALARPARPLFLGRKTCLPAAPLLLGTTEAADPLAAILTWPLHERATNQKLSACWPAEVSGPSQGRLVRRYDRREWRNQLHVGARDQLEDRIEWRIP